ncbi:hypothetical protein AB0O34_27195 [Sphaerisporangium sp. NPDC088356]|uniref:hypothetical protein n=1 Tax=Sphaerisporangium sp. NPDC088356 TaxID=3154871 RepID=UPI0034434F5D
MLASLVPWVLVASTESGYVHYIPLVSFAALFMGVAARSLFVLDIFITGNLPLLVLLAAVCCRRWRAAGMVVAALLGAMAVINLTYFLGGLPREFTPADLSASSQPDFYLSTGQPGIAMLAAVAYAFAAVMLVVGSRRGKVPTRPASA